MNTYVVVGQAYYYTDNLLHRKLNEHDRAMNIPCEELCQVMVMGTKTSSNL